MKPVGEPDAGAPHVRFDERGWETGRCRKARTTAPILDSTSKQGLEIILDIAMGQRSIWADAFGAVMITARSHMLV